MALAEVVAVLELTAVVAIVTLVAVVAVLTPAALVAVVTLAAVVAVPPRSSSPPCCYCHLCISNRLECPPVI